MRTDPPTGLPDRAALLSRLEEMIGDGGQPVLFLISVDGFVELCEGRDDVAAAGMAELGGRLSRTVRSTDVLAALAPGRFALGGPGVEELDASTVLERMRGVFAVPVHVRGEFASFPITVGVALAGGAASGSELLARAESDLEAKLRT